MASVRLSEQRPLSLSAPAAGRLRKHLEQAIRRARPQRAGAELGQEFLLA
jgi:hypothetical protein